MIRPYLGLFLFGAGIGVLAGRAANLPCYPLREPPAPVWQSWMENDPQFRNQYIFFSEDYGEIIIRFEQAPDRRSPQRGEPHPRRSIFRGKIHNRIVPDVKASVVPGGKGYLYRYEVANQAAAKDAITSFSIVAPDAMERPPTHFWRWHGPVMSYGPPRIRQALLPGLPPGRFLSWVYDVDKGAPIAPGHAESGFVVQSAYSPGFTTANLASSPRVEWEEVEEDPEPWPDAVVNQVDPVLRWETLDCNVLTIGPAFRPDEDNQVVARQLRLAIDQLAAIDAVAIDSPFVAEVVTLINEIMGGGTPASVISNKPRGERETEIAQVVRFSLRIPAPVD